MSTEFITFLPAPGSAISNYDRAASASAQADSIPQPFVDAMSIRENVYVKEQGVPIENELDSDDARSYHWVTYASVGAPTSTSSALPARGPATNRRSTASRLAVGTIRLVPPPHPPHPHAGSTHQIDNSENAEKVPMEKDAANSGPTSSFNPHNEPYVKLGRLAILKDFRRMGLGKLLLDNTIQWAARNPDTILPPPSATEREAARMENNNNPSETKAVAVTATWDGLILVHAQKHLERMWQKLGFETDATLGEWMEEGIPHIGMWRRIKVKKTHK